MLNTWPEGLDSFCVLGKDSSHFHGFWRLERPNIHYKTFHQMRGSGNFSIRSTLMHCRPYSKKVESYVGEL